MKNTRIGFIGLGNLGMPCAEVFAEHYPTCGFDINRVESDTVTVYNSLGEVVTNSDWIFIAVPTPHEKEYDGSTPTSHLPIRDFDYDIVKQVLHQINATADASKNIVLISTVLPGTTRREFDHLLENHNLIYNPYLIAMGSVKWDMVNPEMLIVGTETHDDPRREELISIYAPLMQNNPRIEGGTWEEAEAVKIFYNTYISAKIGIVNMIQDAAMKVGHMNAEVVASALGRSTMRLQSPQYMIPGMGDSGACHPRDNIALSHFAAQYDLGYDLFAAIMEAREEQAYNMARFISDTANEHDLPIVIHGKAYKPDVPYTIGSYSLLVGHYLENDFEQKVYYADPLTCDNIVAPFQAVVLLAHNAEITYHYTGSIAKTPFYYDIPAGSVIIDPWRRMNRNITKYKVIHYGDTR
jgi:UDPglucose 6-dehydrogenase